MLYNISGSLMIRDPFLKHALSIVDLDFSVSSCGWCYWCWLFILVETMKPWHNKSLQPTRDGRFRRRCAMARQSSSAIAEDVIRPACLSTGR